MPEGPEIRRAADKVAHVLVGNTVESVAFGLPQLERFERRSMGSRNLFTCATCQRLQNASGSGIK